MIVAVDKSHSQVIIDVKLGLDKGCFVYYRLGWILGYGNNITLNGPNAASMDGKC